MINALLVDDEKNGIINLQHFLQVYFPNDIAIVGVANSVDEAHQKYVNCKPDLIFLDIEMPRKNGFELLKELSNEDFEVIFVTAYNQYGIDAIKFLALDYILKPIDINDLRVAIQKAKKRIEEKKMNQSLHHLIDYLRNEKDKSMHKIAIASMKETRFVLVSDIVHCESQNSYTIFNLKNGETIIASTSISEYEKMLSHYHFIRCHQSHLVNKIYIKSLMNDEGSFLVLDNGAKIPVSRQKKDFVKDRLKNN